MSTNLVIAAIPAEDDRVWKVSSEKVPHLTILHLGDSAQISNLQQIMEFVEHAASTSLKRFYLPVERRGELGDAKADVLFFKKGRYDFKAVRDFRNLLLKDQNIKTAYDAASQFEAPEQVGEAGHLWIPHLTLGYPETPAKPLPDDQLSLYSVDFDKIAVWPSEYEGPSWILKDYWDELEECGVDMDAPLHALHSGVKGMRWGHRKDTTVTIGGKTKMVTAKKAEKLDDNWSKEHASVGTWLKVHNGAAEHFNANIDAHNNRPEYKDLNINKDPNSDLSKKYMTEVHNISKVGLQQSVDKIAPSPTGKYKVGVVHGENYGEWGLVKEEVKHAVELGDDMTWVKAKFENGKVIGIELSTRSPIVHTVDVGAEFVLEHHGVKGMRWGVRNAGKKVGRGAKKVGRGLVTLGSEALYETNAAREATQRDVTSKAASSFAKHDVPRIDAKYKGTTGGSLKGRLKNPLDPTTRAYRSESRIAYRDRINEEVAKLPTNKSGTRRYEIEDGGKTNAQYVWSLKAVDVKRTVEHANEDGPSDGLGDFDVRPVFDGEGFITGVEFVGSSLAQSVTDLGAAFVLEHYGVKGMHWGQRRDRTPHYVKKNQRQADQFAKKGENEQAVRENRPAASVHVHDTIGVSRAKKTKIHTVGGEDHPAHEDAVKVAEARQKLAKSGPAALSNKELQNVANRIELEDRVSRVTQSKGRKFVSKQLGQTRDQTAQFLINREVRKKL